VTALAVAAVAVAVAALGLAGLTVVNVAGLRRLRPHPTGTVGAAGPVTVLLPLRDEAHRVRPCLRGLLAQRGVPGLRVLVLDDGSTDGTADVVRHEAAGDPRVRLLAGRPLPDGWLGKPHACHQLAGAAARDARPGEVLAFLDADVVLHPDALAGALAARRPVDLLSPYPRIVADSAGQRLVQPLLQWSWLALVPLRAMERTRRPSLAVAGGQFLLVDLAAYQRAGGHAAVRDRVLEDVELARAVVRTGGRIAVADASAVADCRMYDSWSQLVDGYAKSLWAAFGSPAAAAAVTGLLAVLYLAPPLLLAVLGAGALTGSAPAGAGVAAGASAAAYLAGVASRVVAGRATGARTWPDALAHPVSVALFGWLVARSNRLRRRGGLAWKGRPVHPPTPERPQAARQPPAPDAGGRARPTPGGSTGREPG
jgi:hypothetical protein